MNNKKLNENRFFTNIANNFIERIKEEILNELKGNDIDLFYNTIENITYTEEGRLIKGIDKLIALGKNKQIFIDLLSKYTDFSFITLDLQEFNYQNYTFTEFAKEYEAYIDSIYNDNDLPF